MFDHDRRSYALPTPLPEITGRKPRKRWARPDVARPQAPRRPLPPPSADPIVPQLDPPEPLTRLDLAGLLPQAARMDIAAGSLAGNHGCRA